MHQTKVDELKAGKGGHWQLPEGDDIGLAPAPQLPKYSANKHWTAAKGNTSLWTQPKHHPSHLWLLFWLHTCNPQDFFLLPGHPSTAPCNIMPTHLISSITHLARPRSRGFLNTPDERCTCQARMPGSVGFFFLALPVLVPWEFFLVFFC